MISPKFRGNRVYIVVWPEQQFVKAGYTAEQRWRKFANLGAGVYALTLFRDSRSAFAYESECDATLDALGVPAFATKAASVAYMGPSGGGYMETYYLPDLAMLQALPEPPLEHCLPGPHRSMFTPDWSLPEAIHERNGRDGLTRRVVEQR